MEALILWWDAYGLLAVLMGGGFAAIWWRLGRIEAANAQMGAGLAAHERACQEDRVRRATWEGKVGTWLKAHSRRLGIIERRVGMLSSPEPVDLEEEG